MILIHKLTKSTEVIFDYLTDMQKFVSIHPVIHKMDHLGGNQYRVHETLPVGFIPYSFTYTATVQGDRQHNIVVIEATVLRINRIKMTFTLTQESGFPTVREEVLFLTPLPLHSVMASVFEKQHKQLFENIDQAP